MIQPVTYFSDAYHAWQQWHFSRFDDKYELLQTFKFAIENQDENLAKIMSFHLTKASKFVATPHQLEGTTGESNELYCTGRGVALLVVENAEDSLDQVLLSAFSMLTAALITGNTVIVCSDNSELNQILNNALCKVNQPLNLLQVAPLECALALIEKDIRTLGFVGSKESLQSLNIQLAERGGAIVNIVFETELTTPTLLHNPMLALRFISERTRTINITAVGGNARLLELGNKAEI